MAGCQFEINLGGARLVCTGKGQYQLIETVEHESGLGQFKKYSYWCPIHASAEITRALRADPEAQVRFSETATGPWEDNVKQHRRNGHDNKPIRVQHSDTVGDEPTWIRRMGW